MRRLDRFFLGYDGPPFVIRFPEWSWHSDALQQPVFSLVFRRSQTFDKLIQPSETGLAEAFVSGDLEVRGDIFCAFDLVEWLLKRPESVANRIMAELFRDGFALANYLAKGPKHSPKRDAAAISHHYDLPVEFYEPWLGPSLLYSTAYFRHSAEDLDAAQTSKLDLICRKLDLQPGDRFMDIGCGWGSLAIHAASQYGARTRGITISRKQARVAA
ncbi:MAG: SAM-dependent methyltransferase, partial [Terracidiphilus sp.]